MPCVPISSSVSLSNTSSLSIVMGGQNNGQGLTYNQLLQSLGKYNFGAEFFYLSGETYTQIGQPVFYNHFDANGNSISTFLPFYVDPYQSQPSIYYEVEPDQIIFTRLSSLSLNIEANSTLYFKFFAQVAYVGNQFDDKSFIGGQNSFQEFEKAEGVKFFEDYCDYLFDNE